MAKEEKKEYYKQWYLKNREKRLEYQKQYRQEHKEYKKQYQQEHKEEIKEYQKQYYQDNKEEIAERRKQYQQEHKSERAENQKQWRKTPLGRANALLSAYAKADRDRNRGECTLTAQWIVDNIFTSKCHWCKETDWTKLGCDRIDNSKPHTTDNVVPCCEDCNKKRGKKAYEKFKDQLRENLK